MENNVIAYLHIFMYVFGNKYDYIVIFLHIKCDLIICGELLVCRKICVTKLSKPLLNTLLKATHICMNSTQLNVFRVFCYKNVRKAKFGCNQTFGSGRKGFH